LNVAEHIGTRDVQLSLDTLLDCCNFHNRRGNKTQAAIASVALIEKEKKQPFYQHDGDTWAASRVTLRALAGMVEANNREREQRRARFPTASKAEDAA
jgi:hypothetical protein